jgi:hypothetical protein
MSEDNDQTTVEEATELTPVPEVKKVIDPNDVDASWDGKGSLDEHRQKAFETIEQPGFGDAGKGKVIADGE